MSRYPEVPLVAYSAVEEASPGCKEAIQVLAVEGSSAEADMSAEVCTLKSSERKNQNN